MSSVRTKTAKSNISKSPAKVKKSKPTSLEQHNVTQENKDNNDAYAAADAMQFSRQIVPPKEQLQLTAEDLDQEIVKRLQALDPYAAKAAVRFSSTDRVYKLEPVTNHLLIHHSQDGWLKHYVSVPVVAEQPAGKGGRGRSSLVDATEERSSVALPPAPSGAQAAAGEGKRLRNRFNFMDTGSQTVLHMPRSRGTLTDLVPRADFGATCMSWTVHEAHEGSTLEGKGAGRTDSSTAQEAAEDNDGAASTSLLGRSSTLLERLVTHNSHHDLLMDFKYFDDEADAYQALQGTLLPLWEFVDKAAQRKAVTAIVWSKQFPDLLAAGYGSFEFQKQLHGLILCWSLKQPRAPQCSVKTQSGVMCLDFHHAMPHLLLCGCYDGSVAIYDVSEPVGVLLCQSSTLTWQHSDPVWGVSWQVGETPKTLTFVSVSSDGHVTSWRVDKANLHHQHIMELTPKGADDGQTDAAQDDMVADMSHSGSCLAFNKVLEQVYLVGTLEGGLSKCSEAYTSEALMQYEGHKGAVYAVQWNPNHSGSFLSASSDWTVKLWDSTRTQAVMSFDLGSPVGDAAWCPQGATVFAAVTESGQVSVFNLRRHKALPVCQQKVAPRGARLTKLAFNAKHPILVVGTDGGHIRCLKLSPNLRPGPGPKPAAAATEAAKASGSTAVKARLKPGAAAAVTKEIALAAAAAVDIIAEEHSALDSIMALAVKDRA